MDLFVNKLNIFNLKNMWAAASNETQRCHEDMIYGENFPRLVKVAVHKYFPAVNVSDLVFPNLSKST